MINGVGHDGYSNGMLYVENAVKWSLPPDLWTRTCVGSAEGPRFESFLRTQSSLSPEMCLCWGLTQQICRLVCPSVGIEGEEDKCDIP
ncbi:hypothetical protein CEXT_628651 [Caerostris extrusa]|uniref:Uncharacterized protein n=1 Tax=Caerostris extrusa TaxID=172846 RepID=A0AAV4U6U7_CAEEX|nr:hypothetical protein CEXT_628651 [Caerostris extrusa]